MKLTNWWKIDFQNDTGKGIKIAIVYSGIDSTNLDGTKVQGGVLIKADPVGRISYDDNFDNITGHGAICAELIGKVAPAAQIYGVGISGKDHRVNSIELAESIRWAIEMGINVISLSIDPTDETYEPELIEACNEARAARRVLIAASHIKGLINYPALFPNVIGVRARECSSCHEYFYHPGSQIEFSACGDPQRLGCVNPWDSSAYGASFAAAHVAGIVSLVLEECFMADPHQVRGTLIANARISPNSDGKKVHTSPGNSVPRARVGCPSWIKKAALYPYDDDMHNFIRFREFLNFEIAGVADFPQRGLGGKDAGEVALVRATGTQIFSDIVPAMEDADTLIVGNMHRLIWEETLQKAIELGRNIYSLRSIDSRTDSDIIRAAKQKGLRLGSPQWSKNFALDWEDRRLESVKAPVLGLLSMSSKSSGIVAQLALRKQLIKAGHKVGQLGTEPYCELFGFDVALPSIYLSDVRSLDGISQTIRLLEMTLMDIYTQRMPDVFIVGIQGRIIPHSFSINQCLNSFSILTLLHGAKPDAYILAIDESDHPDLVRESIIALKAFGKRETILIVLNPKTANIDKLSQKNSGSMSQNSYETRSRHLEEQLGIPATDVVSESGQEKLGKVVLDYIAAARQTGK